MKKPSITQMFIGTFPQLIASLIGTLGAISDGMQYGWTAPIIPILQQPNSTVPITKNDEIWLENLYLIGSIAGLPITIHIVDRIGRQKSILFAACNSLIAWILIGVANRVEYLFVARFFAGLAADVQFVAAPMYVAEIADHKIRGFLAGLIYLMMLIGILLIYSIVPYVPFYVPSIVGGGLMVTQLIVFSLMPESPYYLLSKGNTERATKSLIWLKNTSDVQAELDAIRESVERDKIERGGPQDLFLIKSQRKAFIVIGFLNAAQHFCGITVILMNVHTILNQAGSIYINPNSVGIIFSATMLISATISSLYVDKYGRKILLVLSCILTALSLLTLAIYFHLKQMDYDLDSVSWIPIVCVMLYAIVFKFGLGMVPIVITAEIFSANVKALGMTLSDTMYIVFSLLSLEVYQFLNDDVGMYVPFYIFAAIGFISAIFCATVVPETKGKTLDEIQLKLEGKYRSKLNNNNNNNNIC